jgi:hypothetical protein
MNRLNEHQIRHVAASLHHVDDLLQSLERIVGGSPSPFSRERGDLSQDEARLLLSFVELARSRMLEALDRLGIPRPMQTLSARWSVETTLGFAEIALADARVENLRGYGAVDEHAAGEVEVLVADLRALIRRGKALLHEHDPGRPAIT